MKKLFLLMAVVLFAACEPTTETKVSKEDIVSTLKVNAENLQDAILKQDLVEFNKYVDQNIPFTIGQSNLEQFFEMTAEKLKEEGPKFGKFKLYDIKVALSPDSETAVLTFYAKGDYTVNDSINVDYSTRASSVWVSTENGWKIMHSNWAPLKGGTGIPQ
jgi:ketosteroid isomerase-like protein